MIINGINPPISTIDLYVYPFGYKQCPKCTVLYRVDPVFGKDCPCCKRVSPGSLEAAIKDIRKLITPRGSLLND